MIEPIIAAQNSSPVAALQQNAEGQSVLNSHTAQNKIHEQERMAREAVVKKDEAVLYEQSHDAKEEGKNKYTNLYGKPKKKKNAEEEKKEEVNRVNFDIRI